MKIWRIGFNSIDNYVCYIKANEAKLIDDSTIEADGVTMVFGCEILSFSEDDGK